MRLRTSALAVVLLAALSPSAVADDDWLSPRAVDVAAYAGARVWSRTETEGVREPPYTLVMRPAGGRNADLPVAAAQRPFSPELGRSASARAWRSPTCAARGPPASRGCSTSPRPRAARRRARAASDCRVEAVAVDVAVLEATELLVGPRRRSSLWRWTPGAARPVRIALLADAHVGAITLRRDTVAGTAVLAGGRAEVFTLRLDGGSLRRSALACATCPGGRATPSGPSLLPGGDVVVALTGAGAGGRGRHGQILRVRPRAHPRPAAALVERRRFVGCADSRTARDRAGRLADAALDGGVLSYVVDRRGCADGSWDTGLFSSASVRFGSG